jgi:23S rRNA G2445 N2-methylase RlmL
MAQPVWAATWGATRPWQRLTMPSAATQNWWTRRIQGAAEAAQLPPVVFIENDPEQVRELEQNMARVAGSTTVHLADAFGFRLEHQGLTVLPLHPPYGLRLSEADPVGLYRDLGQQVRQWGLETPLVGFCLCPSEETWRAFRAGLSSGMRLETSHLTQGGLDVRWCGFASQIS